MKMQPTGLEKIFAKYTCDHGLYLEYVFKVAKIILTCVKIVGKT